MTKLSIVIISDNRKEYLEKCLNSIFNQKNLNIYKDIIEVVIVTANENEVSSNLISEKNIYQIPMKIILNKYIGLFNRSYYRNLGIKASAGSKVLFLDSDIVLSEYFLNNFQKNIERDVIGVHYLYGYKVSYGTQLAIDMLNWESVPSMNEMKTLGFSDYRESSFELCNYHLDKLADCWTLAWSGILSVPRKFIDAISGFDESFLNWGGEDTDFAYRLYKQGYIFCAFEDAYGVHIPHTSEKKDASDLGNRNFFHEITDSIESEITLFYPTFLVGSILQQIESSYLLNLNHTDMLIKEINLKLKRYPKTLAVGLSIPKEMELLDFNHYFIAFKNKSDNIKRINSKKEIISKVGLTTKFSDNYFDIVYIFDSFQFLPEHLYQLLLIEMNRISKKIIETNFISDIPPYYKNNSVGGYYEE